MRRVYATRPLSCLGQPDLKRGHHCSSEKCFLFTALIFLFRKEERKEGNWPIFTFLNFSDPWKCQKKNSFIFIFVCVCVFVGTWVVSGEQSFTTFRIVSLYPTRPIGVVLVIAVAVEEVDASSSVVAYFLLSQFYILFFVCACFIWPFTCRLL